MVQTVLYGILSQASVRLSEIARSLDAQTSLRKVIDRLSRQLKRPGLRVAVRRGSRQVLQLYQEFYSKQAPDFNSENEKILKAVETVWSDTGGRGI